MAVLGREIRITRPEEPRFPIDGPIMGDGQPSTSCWQHVWCVQQVGGPVAHIGAGEEVCSTTCMRQVRLPDGFTPLVD